MEDMSFLLRVSLPDVPGSLGAVATALGAAGADIEAIEIVERRGDGTVVDDVLLQLPTSVMPDALVTACHAVDGVSVEWISRYAAGASLTMDLETVEAFTSEPARAIARMVELLPGTFRTDWAIAVSAGADGAQVLAASATAPEPVADLADWLKIDGPRVLPEIAAWDATVLIGAPAQRAVDGEPFVVALGRRGGPDFLASELARLGHMVALVASVQS